MKLKLFLIIFIIALSALAYFGYPIIRSRYFDSEQKIIITNPSAQDAEKTSKTNTDAEQTSQESKATFESDSLKISVNPSDCDNECSNFKKDDELEYCKEICGLSALEKTEKPDGCENKLGIQKDYCLKDLGIEKKDFKICEQISDNGIKKTCQNRITEDIMENL